MRLSQFLFKGAFYLAAFAGAVSAQSIAVLSGSQGSSTSFPVFTVDPATNRLYQQTTANGVPTGAFQLYTKPAGSASSWYYLASATPGLTVLDRSFATPRQILSELNTTPRLGVFSPDGRRLSLIVSSQVSFLDTSTDKILTTMSVGGQAIDVAFSHDGRWAFILSSGTNVQVTRVDMTTLAANGSPLTLAMGAANGIVTAPNGLLYVSGSNGLYEVNPSTLTQTAGPSASKPATIPADNTNVIGRVQFTSDSQSAVGLDRVSGSAVVFNIPNRTANVVSTANLSGSADQLIVASSSRIFVHTTTNQLYELSLAGGFSSSPVMGLLPQGSAVQTMLVSSEVQAKTLFIVAAANGASNLYRVDLAGNSLLDSPIPIQTSQSCTLTVCSGAPPVLALASPNPTSGASSMAIFNSSQTVPAGALSLPLVARVTDSNGVPVFGTTVNFSVLNGSVTLSSLSANTNYNGFAQVYATAGANSGTATVQASVSGVAGTASYNITISGSSGGGGGGGGCTQNCPAAGLFIYSGNGQLVFEQQPASDLLMVIVKDQNGNPVAGQSVTFAVTQGTGTTACTGIGDQFPYIPTGTCTSTSNPGTGLTNGDIVLTDSKGFAGVKFYATGIFNQSFAVTTITATSGAGSVSFVVTTLMRTLPNGGGQAPLPAVLLIAPQADSLGRRIIQGNAGQTVKGAIQVQVFASAGPQAGQPIPNVALNVNPPFDPNTPDPNTSPSGSCAGGSPLSDATGSASCDLVLGPVVSPSPAALNVNIGSALKPPSIAILVAQGSPSKINVLQGNGQSGNPGTQFLLKGQVVDAAGNPVAGVPVSWAVTQGSGTLSGQSQQTDSSGVAQANLTLGSTPGNVVVTLTASPSGAAAFSATFTLTVNATIGGVAVVSGSGQTAVAGQPFGQLLTVKVTDTTGKPSLNVTVSFAVASGSATLSAPTGVTDVNGNASVGATAGTGVGPVTVTASVGSQSAQFSLTVRAPGPSITATSFSNGASGAPGLTPCGIAIVSGPGLAPNVQGTVVADEFGVGPLPPVLAGDSLTVNGIQAPIYWVSNTAQGGEAVAFQTPCEVTAGLASVVVTVNSGNTTVSNVPVVKYQPGVFTTTIGGKAYAVVQRLADGSFVTPANPALRGDQLKVFVTGLGTGMPPTGTNKAGIGGQASDAIITMGLNNAGVRTIGSEYLPGAIGIFTITFEVPADTATGPYQPLGLIVSDPADATNTPIFALPTYIPIS